VVPSRPQNGVRENHGQLAKGKAKEAVGGATDDESLKAEGEAGQASADVRQAG
jgi:uncharacterized protein YjbJ (UPF0337 family)